jgi:hypothetical protein
MLAVGVVENARYYLRGVSHLVYKCKAWQGVAWYTKGQGLGSHRRLASVIKDLA